MNHFARLEIPFQSTPAQSTPAQSSGHPRTSIRLTAGFALPLVMLVSFFAAGALAIMVERQSTARLAAARQIAGYQQHHAQAGLKQLQTAWSQLFRTDEDVRQARGIIGYDITVEGAFEGGRMEVRLTDAQGTLRRRTVDLDPAVCDVLNDAADQLAASKSGDLSMFRDRGPGQVSLDTAPAEVLTALARAVDPSASASAFAEAVIQMRSERHLTQADMRPLTQATGLPDEKLRILEQCVVTDATLWQMVATTRGSTGGFADRQGGLVVGVIKAGISSATPGAGAASGQATPAANAAAPSISGGNGSSNWTFLSWGTIDDAEAGRIETQSNLRKK